MLTISALNMAMTNAEVEQGTKIEQTSEVAEVQDEQAIEVVEKNDLTECDSVLNIEAGK